MGNPVGASVGLPEGEVGMLLGEPLGAMVGTLVGWNVGGPLGVAVGNVVGAPVGDRVVGAALVGDLEGAAVATVHACMGNINVAPSTSLMMSYRRERCRR